MMDYSNCPTSNLAPEPAPAVVLVHGLWMGDWIMRWLGQRLENAGFRVLAFSYPSMAETLDANAEALARFAGNIDAPAVHFVGHSLGGILVVSALSRRLPQCPGRAVLLGSPYCGSHAARQLARSAPGRALLGRSLQYWLQAPPHGWETPVELGIVAGDISLGLGRLIDPHLPQPNDGVVTVEETRVTGASAHIVLPVSHSGMLLSQLVAHHVIHFLKHGRFNGESKAA